MTSFGDEEEGKAGLAADEPTNDLLHEIVRSLEIYGERHRVLERGHRALEKENERLRQRVAELEKELRPRLCKEADPHWYEWYELLKEWKVNNEEEWMKGGPAQTVEFKGKKLGSWMINQKNIKRGSGKGHWNKTRETLLNDLGIVWDVGRGGSPKKKKEVEEALQQGKQ